MEFYHRYRNVCYRQIIKLEPPVMPMLLETGRHACGVTVSIALSIKHSNVRFQIVRSHSVNIIKSFDLD